MPSITVRSTPLKRNRAVRTSTAGSLRWRLRRRGSDLLLASQLKDGSWQGAFAMGGADTCFALLFLTKADLAPGLTKRLKGQQSSLSQLASKEPAEEKPEPTPEEKELERLSKQLAQAPPAVQEKLLLQLRDHPAPLAPQVLVQAMPQLAAAQQAKARQYLAQRLARLPAFGVEHYLKEENSEWRRAAALACSWQKQSSHIPALIPLLEDKQEAVAQAAHQALKALSGRDLGPRQPATEAEVSRAVAAWQAWWDKQGKGKR
jgi:hypothetical protein